MMNDLKINNMAYYLEYAQFLNGEFHGWIDGGTYGTKREAWNVIKGWGYTAAQKGDRWMVSEVVSHSPTGNWLDDAYGRGGGRE